MYILNHTNTTLSVGQFADIPPGKYIKADKYVLESLETAYAVRAKWASLHEAVPKELTFDNETINFETPAIEGSTEYPGAEPKAKPAEEPKAEVDEEPKAEAVEEPAAEPEAPVSKKSTRKAAAE